VGKSSRCGRIFNAAVCGIFETSPYLAAVVIITGCYYVELGKIAHFSGEIRRQWEVTRMADEPTIEQLLEPSTVLSRALDFMETDLDAGAYNVISAWVARAIREIGEDLASAQAIDEEALKGLPAARMKIEGGKLWLRIFEQIQKAIPRYAPAGEG